MSKASASPKGTYRATFHNLAIRLTFAVEGTVPKRGYQSARFRGLEGEQRWVDRRLLGLPATTSSSDRAVHGQ
jgi:hypothetical protein